MGVGASIGAGLGVIGGIMLGGQLFSKQAAPDEDKYAYLDQSADGNPMIPDPEVTGVVTPEFRQLLKHAPKWTKWPDFEQVRWVNSIIEWLWPHLNKGICKMATETLKPILDDLVSQQANLDGIVIDSLNLGSVPMRLAGIKVYDSKDDEVILEVPLQWGSDAKISVAASLRVGPVAMLVPVKVEDLQMSANARITIRPLVDTLPCLGAISISLTEPPAVDLCVRAINEWDIMCLPFVHDIVQSVVKMVTEAVCVYPNQIDVPLMENCGLPKEPCGMLEVRIIKATNLKSTDMVGKADPYVELCVREYKTEVRNDDNVTVVVREGRIYKTEPHSNTSNPEFKEYKKVLVTELGKDQFLNVSVMDYDIVGANELIGETDIVLDPEACEFLRNTSREFPVERDLLPKKGSVQRQAGTKHGRIYLMMQWTPFNVQEEEVADMEGAEEARPASAPRAMQAVKSRISRHISESSKGVLNVNVYRCSDLPLVGKTCDSICVMKLSDPANPDGPEFQTSAPVLNEINPRFRMSRDFVYISSTSVLTVIIYDKPGRLELGNIVRFGHQENTQLGKVRVLVKDVARIGRIKDVFPLQESEQGDVHMALSWTPVEKE